MFTSIRRISSGKSCIISEKNILIGQNFERFVRFVAFWDSCRYKLEKNWRLFLDGARNRLNFASDLRFTHKLDKFLFHIAIIWVIN
jgi:hypothetical protein